MNKKTFTLIAASFLFSFAVMAQVVSKDSMNTLKQHKEVLDLKRQLNDRKIKLAKLENSVEKETRDMKRAEENAQKSADDNSAIAEKLNTNSTDKKLSKKAKKAARQAKRSAKSARKATKSLEDLQKDIESLRKKITEDEKELNSRAGN